jgi:hypothetical protein
MPPTGSPVQFVSVPLVGVPRIGVTSVGVVANTNDPVPVSSVTAERRFALDGVAKNVATPVPRPLTPVLIGNPVAFVRVPDEGVPRAPPFTTKAPAEPTFVPRAVTTPVPVVVADGPRPAPPPISSAPEVKTPVEAQVDVLLKYGTPPDVPATVRANVPLLVIGEPATEIKPPVKVCPTEVTVPPPPPETVDQLPSPRK